MDSQENSTPATNAICPRCGSPFHCGSLANETDCGCMKFSLSAELLMYLRDSYSGCLCPTCLGSLAARGTAIDQKD